MPNKRRRLEGRVVSNKMDKTVVVAIERRKLHPIYKKVVRTTKKIMAHDESNELEIGALVRVVESKPLSRHKRWVVEAVIQEKGFPVLEALPDEAVLDNSSSDTESATEEGGDE
jgi:small subunit ribosomal protein S17